ncbi:MAG: hypothetical protein ACOVP8_08855 [Phycisphaerales bacterium]
MRETRVQITGTCAVVLSEWVGIHAQVCIVFLVRQSDRYYTVSETTADIDAETAAQIINVLYRAFPQLQTTPTRGPSMTTDTEQGE